MEEAERLRLTLFYLKQADAQAGEGLPAAVLSLRPLADALFVTST
jgi:hypothetical protein